MRLRALRVPLLLAVVIVWGFRAPFSALGNTNLGLGYAIIALSLVILTGWVGQISLAQASFVGIGAYVTGLLVRSYNLDFPLTIIVSAVAAAAAAALVGLVALRVRGLYLAVATLIFAWMTQAYLFNQPWIAGVGGSSSAKVPALGEEGTFPYLDFQDRRTYYFVLVVVLLAGIVASANVRDSKTGRAWFAVKGSEVAAASLGVDVVRYKLLAFASSGFLAGAAGALIFTHQEVTLASTYEPNVSLFYLAIAVVGGLSSIGGAITSGLFFASLQELFDRYEALSGSVEIVSAVLLAVVLLFFPAGLAGLPPRLRTLIGRARVPDAVGRLATPVAAWVRRPRKPEDGEEEIAVGMDVDAEVIDIDEEPRVGWWRRVGSSVGATLRRVRPAGDVEPVPDVLAAALGEDEAEAERDHEPEIVAPALIYEPGTATKVSLPARRRRPLVVNAQGITVQFGGLRAVDDFSLEVRQGEIVGLMGPNGAGKTTLFNAIAGLNEPTAGTVELFGADVTKLPVHERARLGMGRTFQAIQLFAQLSVFDNLMVATHHRNPTGFLAHVAATSRSVESEAIARTRVRQVIELIGLGEEADRPVAGLPFGMLRLVELARALVTGSPLVMLDEPASGLDNSETDRFMDLLLWARQRLGITMLLIEHDVRMVTTLCDHIYVIDRGVRIADGTSSEIQRDPAVIAAYLGEMPAADEDEPATGMPGASKGSGRGRARSAARQAVGAKG